MVRPRAPRIGRSPVSTSTLTWLPTQAPKLAASPGSSKSISTGKRCALRSQSRWFCTVGSAPGLEVDSAPVTP